MSDRVTICECFARDGLQHEPAFLATDVKVELINAFAAAGFRRIEATSYSSPTRVPAFQDASAVLAGLSRPGGVSYKATCPNPRAVRRALADLDAGHGADELSLLVSASEAHSARNLRTSREAQWENVAEMARLAAGRFTLVGVVSVALGCPFEGPVPADRVLTDVARFVELGVPVVTIGDTTGHGTPRSVAALLGALLREFPDTTMVAHFHNSRGSAIANCVAALDAGCRFFDSAFGGVGGHPANIAYGQGLTGNVATEDLVNVFEAMGVDTGVDLGQAMAISRRCEQAIGRQLNSMVARAGWGLSSRDVAHA